jgi:hypothetical protein
MSTLKQSLFETLADVPERMDARLVRHRGAMAISVNGQVFPCVSFKATEQGSDALFVETVERVVPAFAAHGVHLYFAPVYFGWDGDGCYDFSRVDRRIEAILQHDPQAYIVIRIQAACFAPTWWMADHPDEVLTFGSGREPDVRHYTHKTSATPSFASTFWEREASDALRALAAHVCDSHYAAHVIGYMPCAFNSNEWFVRSYQDGLVSDFSPAMQRAYQAYMTHLTGKAGDYPIPDRLARGEAEEGFLMHPDSPVVAYYRLANELCAQAILQLTQVLREAHAPDRILIGAFYGYQMDLANFHWLPDSGHLALSTLLDADDGPDFFSSPLDYFGRNLYERPGGGFCWAQGTAPDSAPLVGKAYIGEDDAPPPRCADFWSWAGDTEQDVEMLKRNFAFTLCKGQLQWWYDLVGHWYDDPHRLAVVKQCTAIAHDALEYDRTPVSQVAVVLDERASWYCALDFQMQRAINWESFFHSFDALGMPVDLYLQTDLPRVDPARYRAIFFLSPFALTGEERAQVARFKQGGRLLAFSLWPGYLTPGGGAAMSEASLSDLVGMQVSRANFWYQLRLTLRDDHPLVAGLGSPTYGTHRELAETMVVTDPAAMPLAHYNGRGRVGMAMRTFPEWTSVYSAIPGWPAPLAARMAEMAGAHRYITTNDVLYANRSYVALFAREPGVKTIRLPHAARVRELFTGQQIASSPVQEFTWEAAQYRTDLFALA